VTNFYARQQIASRVLAMAWASVCLIFVALLYCIKTAQARITKSSLLAAPRTLCDSQLRCTLQG